MIRKATIEDLPAMEGCAQEFRAASQAIGRQTFDIKRFVTFWENLILSDTGVIFLVDDSTGIQGALGGVAYPDPYNGRSTASEFFWFVRETSRGTAGVRLYRAFETWAREKNCSTIRIVHMVDSMPEKLARVYRSWGYRPLEVHYEKEL